jgi:antitoxin ParD1/3/4
MASTTMNISLPDSMRAFIDEQISADGYGTASEYVRNLIRADQKRLEEQKLERLLLERLKSGNEKEFNVEDVRAKLSKRVRAKKK